MGKVRFARVLAIFHVRPDFCDNGIFQLDGEIMFLGAGCAGAEELELAFGQPLPGCQSSIEQGRRFVENLGDGQWFVATLAGGLAALHIGGDRHFMIKGLN